MNFRRALPRLLSLAVLLCCGVGLWGQAYTTIVVFGDSLSDTGNFARLSANAYGAGLRIPGTAGNYADGRFTDGTNTAPPAQMYTGVWVEQMAATLAAHPVVRASLDGGTDYAYGSATNGTGTQVVMYGPFNGFSVTVQNVATQVASYLATNPVITNRTLFVVWGGANDVLRSNSPFAVPNAAVQEQANIQALITAGATEFLIPNLPPLGAIPRLNGTPSSALMATALSATYNATLLTGLQTLPAANPGKTLHLYRMDVNSLYNSVLVSPGVFGFANVTQMSQLLAVNPDTYLFWDDLHPTTYGHYLISRLAENTLTETTTDTTTLTLGATTAAVGQTVSLKAVVTSASGGPPTPTGLVTFYNGTTPLVAAMVDASGTATSSFAAGPLSVNATTITANYSGDGVYFPTVSAAQTVTVTAPPTPTTTSLTTSSGTVLAGTPVTLTATVSSAQYPPIGMVTFLDGSSTLGTGTLTAGAGASSTATFTTAMLAGGSHSLTAVFAAGAGAGFAGSTSAVLMEVVTPAAPAVTTTTLVSSSGSVNQGTPVTLTATVSSAAGAPAGGVTFLDGSSTLGSGTLTAGATNSTAVFTTSALTAGSHNITAVYGGGTGFGGSSSAAVTVVVTAPAYTFTASPTTVTVASGMSGTTTLTLTSVGGLTGSYALACGTLPAHFSCAFSPATVALAGTGAAQSSTLTIGTNTATAGLLMPVRPGGARSLPVWAALGMLPGLGGLALLGRRRRQLRSLHLTMLLVALSAGAALGVSGCAKSSNNAPSGTYQVPVTATPSGSGSAATLSVTVVVQ